MRHEPYSRLTNDGRVSLFVFWDDELVEVRPGATVDVPSRARYQLAGGVEEWPLHMTTEELMNYDPWKTTREEAHGLRLERLVLPPRWFEAGTPRSVAGEWCEVDA